MSHAGATRSGAVTRALILAGGRATRFGADKTLARLHGRALIEHVIERLLPQVGAIAISGDPDKYAHLGFPVLPDAAGLPPGPLAGIYTGLAAWPDDDLLTVAADMPLLPRDLAHRLRRAGRGHGCAYAGNGRRHALALWWAPGMAPALDAFLRSGHRDVQAWLLQARAARVSFAAAGDSDVMCNVNTPVALADAAARLPCAAVRRESRNGRKNAIRDAGPMTGFN